MAEGDSICPQPAWDHVSGSVPVGVMDAGAGRLDLTLAGTADLSFNPANVSFGSQVPLFSASAPVTVTNTSDTAQTITLSVEGKSSDPGLVVTVSPSTLTLGMGKSATFTVSATGNGTAIGQFDSSVTFATGTQRLRVPYWVSTTP